MFHRVIILDRLSIWCVIQLLRAKPAVLVLSQFCDSERQEIDRHQRL